MRGLSSLRDSLETVAFLDVHKNHITKNMGHIDINKVHSKNGSKVGIFLEIQAERAEFFAHPQQLMITKSQKSQNVGISQFYEWLFLCSRFLSYCFRMNF